MAGKDNISAFSAADIERYHRGLLSGIERHALEKAALEDPFLAEALEGYSDHVTTMADDLIELENRLAESRSEAKIIPISTAPSRFRWFRVAVAIVLIAGAAILSYTFFFSKPEEQLAIQPSPANTYKTDTIETVSLPAQNLELNAAADSVVVSNLTHSGGRKTLKTDLSSDQEVAKSPSASPSVTEAQPGTKPGVKKDADLASSREAGKNAEEKSVVVSADRDGVPDQFDSVSSIAKSAAPKNRAVVAADRNNLGGSAKWEYNPSSIFRGRVTDATGNALAFAKVLNTRDNVGTYSDSKGYFTLTSTDSLMFVQVRSLGFANNFTTLSKNKPENRIVLQEDRSISDQLLDSSRVNYARRRQNNSLNFEEPEPADGWAYYDSYLANNINLPDNLDKQKKNNATDVVEVSFEVNELGEPVNFRVEKSLCAKCDQEAIRLIREGPRWKQKARKSRTTVAIPFRP